MISISRAKTIVESKTGLLETEKIFLPDVLGRVLAENIVSDMDMPPFDRSQMDGFAIKTDDAKNAPVTLKIAGESVAGKGWHQEMGKGEAVRIMTGASVPSGADSVQKVELTKESDGQIKILKPTKLCQNIVKKAQEIKKGETIFEAGEIVTDKMIATLAAFGYSEVAVGKKPKIAILATGSEIVDVEKMPSRDQIRNSNSWMLKAFAEKYADVEILPIAVDDLKGLKKAIKDASERCDCLIISGGVSVGDYDFTKPALREIGAEMFFEKIALKPGKPTVFARLNNTLVFGLPGNPVSIAVTFFVFVRKALLQMQGAKNTELNRGVATLVHRINGVKGRDSLLPVSVSTSKKGKLKVKTLRFSGSSNFIKFAGANALVFVSHDEILKEGEIAKIYFL